MTLTRDKLFWEAFVSHAGQTVRATRLLQQMFETPSEAEPLAAQISAIESQGDEIKHHTMVALRQTWITPLDRKEIYALISKLDDVLDYVEAAAERVALYEISVATTEAIELARVLASSAEALSQAMIALQNIKNTKPLLDLCVKINRLENEADKILRLGLAQLFRKPASGAVSMAGVYRDGSMAMTDPLEVMKWRDIYEILETATDRAEDVANIIESIVLEHG